jgi:hypothetical protein
VIRQPHRPIVVFSVLLIAVTGGSSVAAQGIPVSRFEVGASGGVAAPGSGQELNPGPDLSVVASIPITPLWAVRTQVGRSWIGVVPVEFTRSDRQDTMAVHRVTVGFTRYAHALRDYWFQPHWTMGGGVYRYAFRHNAARATAGGVYGEFGMDFIVAEERAVLAFGFALHVIGGPGDESPVNAHDLYTGMMAAGLRMRF